MTPEFKRRVLDKLNEAMLEQKFGNSEIAEALGLNPSVITMIRNEKYWPKAGTSSFEKVAHFLNTGKKLSEYVRQFPPVKKEIKTAEPVQEKEKAPAQDQEEQSAKQPKLEPKEIEREKPGAERFQDDVITLLDTAMLAILKMENRIRDLELINEHKLTQGAQIKEVKAGNKPIKIEIRIKGNNA